MRISLWHIFYAILFAATVCVAREYLRWRDRVRPRRPDITLEEALEHCRSGMVKLTDLELLPATPSQAIAGPLLAELRASFAEAERRGRRAPSERIAVRQAILGNATLALQLEAVIGQDEAARQALIRGYETGMDRQLRDAAQRCVIRWYVLREYARWKFDDAVRDDWFHHYIHIARPYIREKVRLAGEYVLRTDATAGQFAAVYDTLLRELLERTLKTRPKKRFVKPGLPA